MKKLSEISVDNREPVSSMARLKRPKQIIVDTPHIRGINGLALFLKCSTASAQKLKNYIPHFQSGRIIFFKPEDVLNAFDNPKNGVA